MTEAVLEQFGPEVTDHWAGAVTVALAKYLDCDEVSATGLVAINREFRAYLALLERLAPRTAPGLTTEAESQDFLRSLPWR